MHVNIVVCGRKKDYESKTSCWLPQMLGNLPSPNVHILKRYFFLTVCLHITH